MSTVAPAPTRVVYCDSDPAYRTRLIGAMLADPAVELCAVTVDRAATEAAIAEHHPDLVLLADDLAGDEDLPGAQRVMLVSAEPGRTSRRARMRGVLDRALDPSRASLLVATLGAPS